MKSLAFAAATATTLVSGVVGSHAAHGSLAVRAAEAENDAGADNNMMFMKSCSTNQCLQFLNGAWVFDLRKINSFCNLNGNNTSADQMLSILPKTEAAGKAAEACTKEEGLLSSACECAERGDFCLAAGCYSAIEERLGGKEAVADFCFLGTYGDQSLGESLDKDLTNNTSEKTLDGIQACGANVYGPELQAACRCALPRDREWQFPKCQTNDCYVGMDMLLGEGTGNFCKDLLAGRAGALELVGREPVGRDKKKDVDRGCGFEKQLEACRCAHPAPETAEPECGDGDECLKVLGKNFGGHVQDYCKTVLDGDAARAKGGKTLESLEGNEADAPADAPADVGVTKVVDSYIIKNARELGCEYDALLKACKCAAPQWQKPPACGDDDCRRAIQDRFEDSEEAIGGLCRRTALLEPAEVEAEIGRLGIGDTCAGPDAVAAAGALAEKSPEHCLRGDCFRAIDSAFDGNLATIKPFCGKTLRDLYDFRDAAEPPADYAVNASMSGGCGDARDLDEACSCLYPDDDIWPSPRCGLNKCYRSIETASNDGALGFCNKRYRSRAAPDMLPAPPLPAGVEKGCPSEEDVDGACSCVNPYPNDAWALPHCADDKCYLNLDEVMDGSEDRIKRFCRHLRQSQLYENVPAPKTPAGVVGTCAEPDGLAEACRCVNPEDKALEVAYTECANSDCYRQMDDILSGTPEELQKFCRPIVKFATDGTIEGDNRALGEKVWRACDRFQPDVESACQCVMAQASADKS